MDEDGQQAQDPRELERLLTLLRACGADVDDYRSTVLLRRVRSRMAGLGTATVSEYLGRLEGDPEEVRSLSRALFVQHTRFFRDPEVFEALADRVLPRLSWPARAWSIGVATGEEAYSLAMLLTRCPETSRRGFEVLGSDVDPRCVEIARRASYRAESLLDVPERFRDLVRATATGMEPIDSIRRRVTFVTHDLRSPQLSPAEAIMASYDLVLCRNVLMYLDDRFREIAVARLAEIVRPGGALVLGRVEVLSDARRHGLGGFPGLAPGLGIFQKDSA